MVKIYPTRFFIESADKTDHLWQWINEKVKDTKISQVVPLQMENHSTKESHILKGLIEVHSSENVSTKELDSILKPLPSFIHHIYFTFQ